MHNQAFSKSTLARSLYPDDFYRDDRLADDTYREGIIQSSLSIANSNFEGGASFDYFYFSKKDRDKDKKTYFSTSLAEKLVLRKCAKNISQCINFHPKNRSQICKEIKAYLCEGTKYRVYKLDIKSFFESIEHSVVQEGLSKIQKLSTHSVNLVLGYLKHYPNILPRGLEISPVIADLVLGEFDKKIKSLTEVIYFSRFVDDIVIITTQSENIKHFKKIVRNSLPQGVELNFNKTKIIDINKRSKSANDPNGKVIDDFSYLGYKFSIVDTHIAPKSGSPLAIYRKVVIDLSDKKIKQFETKICKALVNYGKTGDFELLKSRIKFLTTNRDLVQKSSGNKIPTGIYYNYSLLNQGAISIRYLDEKLQAFIMSYEDLFNKSGGCALSTSQKRELLKSSFVNGFNKRIYKKYNPHWLMEITKIWR